jgi:hypothetical protein
MPFLRNITSGLSLLGAPRKWGKKKEKNSCLTYVKWNRSGLQFAR